MGRRLALVIGNEHYEDHGLAALAAPAADVRALTEVLAAAEIGAFDDVVCLMDETASRIQRETARFCNAKTPEDLLLLYFSGHGVLDEDGQLYLAARDTERSLLSGSAVPAAFLTREMDRSRARQQILILDCCHSGAFARGTKGQATVGTGEAFRGTGGAGRFVLTATDSTQYAWEGSETTGEGRCSVFTRHLIEGLRTGEADRDSDGKINPDELYDYIYDRAVKETPNQTPSKWAFRQQGDIWVARNPRPPRIPELPAELVEDINSLLPWKRESTLAQLSELLHGSHRGLALAAEAALRRMAREDDSLRVRGRASELLAGYVGLSTATAAPGGGAGRPAAPLAPPPATTVQAQPPPAVRQPPPEVATEARAATVQSPPATGDTRPPLTPAFPAISESPPGSVGERSHDSPIFQSLPPIIEPALDDRRRLQMVALASVSACSLAATPLGIPGSHEFARYIAEASRPYEALTVLAALLTAFLADRWGKKLFLLIGLGFIAGALVLGWLGGWRSHLLPAAIGRGVVLVGAGALLSDCSRHRASAFCALNAAAVGAGLLAWHSGYAGWLALLLAAGAAAVLLRASVPGRPVRIAGELKSMVVGPRFWCAMSLLALGIVVGTSLSAMAMVSHGSSVIWPGFIAGSLIAWRALRRIRAASVALAAGAVLLGFGIALAIGVWNWFHLGLPALLFLAIFAGPLPPLARGIMADAFPRTPALALGWLFACQYMAGLLRQMWRGDTEIVGALAIGAAGTVVCGFLLHRQARTGTE